MVISLTNIPQFLFLGYNCLNWLCTSIRLEDFRPFLGKQSSPVIFNNNLLPEIRNDYSMKKIKNSKKR